MIQTNNIHQNMNQRYQRGCDAKYQLIPLLLTYRHFIILCLFSYSSCWIYRSTPTTSKHSSVRTLTFSKHKAFQISIDRRSLLGGKHSHFVFERSRVRFPARKQAILRYLVICPYSLEQYLKLYAGSFLQNPPK